MNRQELPISEGPTSASVPTPSPLTELVLGAAGSAEVVAGGEPATVGRLLDGGRELFRGGADGGPVAAVLTNDHVSVQVLLGAMAHGATVVSVPLPSRAADPARYLRSVDERCRAVGAGVLVARDDLAPLLAGVRTPLRRHSELPAHPLPGPGAAATFTLVQHTSGSTGEPRAVALGDGELGANVAAILEVLAPGPGDVAVSWLPLAHDMGLVGMLLTSLAAASPALVGSSRLVLLDPLDVLRSPAAWLRPMSEVGCTVTAAPDFGYRLALRADPAGVDLGRLRVAIVGGEIVRAATLDALVDRFGPVGLNRRALSPAYGMAELGLAASMTPPAEEPAVVEVELGDSEAGAAEAVASGVPLGGYEVVARSEDGRPLGDGSVGQLVVRGPSIGRDGISGAPLVDAAGWYATGDVGTVVGGRVVVLGRLDDHLVVRGRNIHAPSLEQHLADLGLGRAGCIACVGLPSGGWAVALEAPVATVQGTEVVERQAVRGAAAAFVGAAPDEVVLVPRGALPKTASGKLQRWALAGLLGRPRG